MLMSEIDTIVLAHGYSLADMARPKALIFYKPPWVDRVELVSICDGLAEAEDLLEYLYEWADEVGVLRGDYHVDWPSILSASAPKLSPRKKPFTWADLSMHHQPTGDNQ